jgi:hypothetical protein
MRRQTSRFETVLQISLNRLQNSQQEQACTEGRLSEMVKNVMTIFSNNKNDKNVYEKLKDILENIKAFKANERSFEFFETRFATADIDIFENKKASIPDYGNLQRLVWFFDSNTKIYDMVTELAQTAIIPIHTHEYSYDRPYATTDNNKKNVPQIYKAADDLATTLINLKHQKNVTENEVVSFLKQLITKHPQILYFLHYKAIVSLEALADLTLHAMVGAADDKRFSEKRKTDMFLVAGSTFRFHNVFRLCAHLCFPDRKDAAYFYVGAMENSDERYPYLTDVSSWRPKEYIEPSGQSLSSAFAAERFSAFIEKKGTSMTLASIGDVRRWMKSTQVFVSEWNPDTLDYHFKYDRSKNFDDFIPVYDTKNNKPINDNEDVKPVAELENDRSLMKTLLQRYGVLWNRIPKTNEFRNDLELHTTAAKSDVGVAIELLKTLLKETEADIIVRNNTNDDLKDKETMEKIKRSVNDILRSYVDRKDSALFYRTEEELCQYQTVVDLCNHLFVYVGPPDQPHNADLTQEELRMLKTCKRNADFTSLQDNSRQRITKASADPFFEKKAQIALVNFVKKTYVL